MKRFLTVGLIILAFGLVTGCGGMNMFGVPDEPIYDESQSAGPPTAPPYKLTNAEVAAGTATKYGLITAKIYNDNLGAGAGEATTYEVLATNSDIDTDLSDGATASTVPSSAAAKDYADSVAGAPTNVTPVDTGDEDATFYPIIVDGATGSQATETDAGLTYNPSSNTLTAGVVVTGSQTIADNAIVTVDQADAADDEFARFTANGLESLSAAELVAAIETAIEGITTFTPTGTWDFSSATALTMGPPTFADDIVASWGTGADWDQEWDNTLGSMLFSTGLINGSADSVGMFLIRVNDAAGSLDADQFVVEVRDNATSLFSLDAEGDQIIAGDQTVTGSDLTLGTAGVKLTGDGDGAITLLGLGDGSDEDLTINLDDTANTVVLSSSTGVTELDFGAFNMVTNGVIMGGINVKDHTAASYTNGTDDADEVGGTYHFNSDNDAFALTLETAAAGHSGCLENGQGVTAALTLTPATGDYLVVAGVRQTAATAYSSTGAAGDKICWVMRNADDVTITTTVGTWSE